MISIVNYKVRIIQKIIINIFAVWIVDFILPGTKIDELLDYAMVAFALIIFNSLIKPILNIIAFPINIITLGLFRSVLNWLVILFISWLIPGFEVNGFLWGILFSVLFSFLVSHLEMGEKKGSSPKFSSRSVGGVSRKRR
jgi:putative membrane protein